LDVIVRHNVLNVTIDDGCRQLQNNSLAYEA